MGTASSCGRGKATVEEIPSFKIVLVGDPEVGKSSIFLRYIKNQFDYSYQPSMSVSIGNVVKKVNIPCEAIVSVTLWDLPGREEMDLRRSYYKDVDAAVVVVDTDDRDSIGMAGTWKQDIVNNAIVTGSDGSITDADPKSIPILLVGNKADKLKYIEDGGSPDSEESSDLVRCLEEVAVQHGFVGSVTVSAKESDGSVHAAVQSLVRHLLQQRIKRKSGNKKGLFGNTAVEEQAYVSISPLKDEEKEFVPLIHTKISEFDVFFQECNQAIETVERANATLLTATANFKRSCNVAGVTNSTRATLEECIGGLKELIRTEDDDDGLEIHEDGGFVKLVIREDEVKDVLGPVNRVLRAFHNEFCMASKRVLKECPGAHNKLKETEVNINELKPSAFDRALAAGYSQRGAKAALANIDSNNERISEAITIAMETMTEVDNNYKKIKAAMLW